MTTSSPATYPGEVSITQMPSSDHATTATATPAGSTIPSITANTLPTPGQIILPPPSPNTPSLPPSLISTSAHPTSIRSATATATIPITTSSPPLAQDPSATIPSLTPSPRSRKLQSQISTLQSQIAATQTSLDQTLAKLQTHLSTQNAELPPGAVSGPPQSKLDLQKHAEAIVKRHIKLLHAYNEIRDVGQGLMGLIADARGVRLKEVMEEMGVGEKD